MTDSKIISSYPSGRLTSLDVFRGLTMMSMVLVNNPGNGEHIYQQLEHASWDGFTFTDLIFPSFVFIVGTSMAFSFARRLQEGTRQELFIQLVRRSIIIFGLGFLLNSLSLFSDSISNIRILGVLQRIAICYFCTGLMAMYIKPIGLWIAGILLLVIYSLGMLFVPVPGYGAGVLGPEGNLCRWLDTMILQHHAYKGAPVSGFDPEGIWSTLTAIVTSLAGYGAGLLLRSDRESKDKLIVLFTRANICLLLSYLTTAFMPVNKQLWTVPYVFLCAGLDLHLLGMFYYLIDIRGFRRGITPAMIYGSNAIFIYVGSWLMRSILAPIHIGSGEASLNVWDFCYEKVFSVWLNPFNASVSLSLLYVLVWLGITYILYRKKIFIKI